MSIDKLYKNGQELRLADSRIPNFSSSENGKALGVDNGELAFINVGGGSVSYPTVELMNNSDWNCFTCDDSQKMEDIINSKILYISIDGQTCNLTADGNITWKFAVVNGNYTTMITTSESIPFKMTVSINGNGVNLSLATVGGGGSSFSLFAGSRITVQRIL